MRRLLVFPVLLCAAALVVVWPSSRLGLAADAFGRRVCRWAIAGERV